MEVGWAEAPGKYLDLAESVPPLLAAAVALGAQDDRAGCSELRAAAVALAAHLGHALVACVPAPSAVLQSPHPRYPLHFSDLCMIDGRRDRVLENYGAKTVLEDTYCCPSDAPRPFCPALNGGGRSSLFAAVPVRDGAPPAVARAVQKLGVLDAHLAP